MKLWYYSWWIKQIVEVEVIESEKYYTFKENPWALNTFILKSDLNTVKYKYVVADSKEKLIELINDKIDSEIFKLENEIEYLKKNKIN